MANLWDTPILMSVSENLTIFKAVKLPFKTILKVACTTGIQYCASTFKEEKRDYAHWVPGAQIIVIDFDDGLNEFTKSWLKEQFGFLVPTRNYMKEKHGKVCERYRAILLADSPMNVTSGEFVRIYQNLLKDNNLPADTACTDVSRLYYGFGSAETTKYIQVLQGKPLDWKKYNYVDSMEMIGMPSTKKVVDISEYETKVDLSDVPNMNHSKRYECPICALEGLDPNKHHLGFSPEKDLLTCFYDKEGHSPILRALYRKQVLGLDPEIDEDSQEIVEEEVKQPNGKVKKKRVVKPKMEPCLACNGTGKINCTECSGTGIKEDKLIERKQILNEDGTVKEEQEVVTTKSIPCSHCDGKGFFICPECNGEGKVPKKPKPRVKKPSLPDEMIPLRDRKPKGLYHFNERGATLDFDAEYAKYVDEVALGFDVETFYPKEVAITEEEAKEQFKDKYISIAATYKRVVKNLKEKALDEIDNQVRLLIIGSARHQTAFDLTICTEEQIQKLFDLLRTKLMVGHNLKFDIKSIASTYGMDTIPKRVFDTMLGSKILWMMHNTFEPTGTNTYGGVVERYCSVHLPKDQGGSDWGQSELSMEQLVYAVNDVRYLLPVMTKMLQELYKEYSTNYELSPDVDLKQVEPLLGDFLKIHPVMALEMRFVLALARMELHGVMVNESAIRDIVKTHLDEIKEAEEKLGFNPASNPSCLAFVKKIIGPEMESASKEALANYYHIPQIEVLGRAKQAKARAGLLVKMYEHKADGRIHPQFTQILATGRLACIADGTKISCVNGLKNIEDVQVGDLVYCYDNEGQIQIRKVLNKYDNGVRDCVDIKWQASGTGRIGHLICTPDHKIKTKNRGWQQAKDLKRCEKMYHLHRSQSNDINQRVRLYGTNFIDEREECVIKRSYYGASSEMHAHHINGIKQDNRVENIRILTNAEHVSIHSQEKLKKGKIKWEHLLNYPKPRLCGKDHWHYKDVSREQLETMIREAKGVLRKVPMDDATYKIKCAEAGFNWREVAAEYNKKYRVLNVEQVKNAMIKHQGNKTHILKELGVGRIAYEKFCKEHELEFNHMVLKVSEVGERHVWDLEVEEFHNFIANEICVHNCKNPNMQQVPRTVKDYIYRAPAGRVVFSADYPAIELRLCSVWHEEPIMIAAFQRGEDLHYKMAKLMTKKPIPHTDEEKHDTSGKFISKEERTAAKNINFGYIYGAWWTTYQKIQLVKNHLKISDADAKESRRVFMSLYKTIAQHIEQMKYEFDHAKPRTIKMKDSIGNEYTTQAPFAKEVSTLFGRRIAADTVNTALNYGIQGSGGDAAKLAICMFEDICTAENIDAFCCNMIHDDIVIESSIKDKERAMNALSRAMNGAANLLMGHHFLTDVTDEITVFAETPLETAS